MHFIAAFVVLAGIGLTLGFPVGDTENLESTTDKSLQQEEAPSLMGTQLQRGARASQEDQSEAAQMAEPMVKEEAISLCSCKIRKETNRTISGCCIILFYISKAFI